MSTQSPSDIIKEIVGVNGKTLNSGSIQKYINRLINATAETTKDINVRYPTRKEDLENRISTIENSLKQKQTEHTSVKNRRKVLEKNLNNTKTSIITMRKPNNKSRTARRAIKLNEERNKLEKSIDKAASIDKELLKLINRNEDLSFEITQISASRNQLLPQLSNIDKLIEDSVKIQNQGKAKIKELRGIKRSLSATAPATSATPAATPATAPAATPATAPAATTATQNALKNGKKAISNSQGKNIGTLCANLKLTKAELMALEDQIGMRQQLKAVYLFPPGSVPGLIGIGKNKVEAKHLLSLKRLYCVYPLLFRQLPDQNPNLWLRHIRWRVIQDLFNKKIADMKWPQQLQEFNKSLNQGIQEANKKHPLQGVPVPFTVNAPKNKVSTNVFVRTNADVARILTNAGISIPMNGASTISASNPQPPIVANGIPAAFSRGTNVAMGTPVPKKKKTLGGALNKKMANRQAQVQQQKKMGPGKAIAGAVVGGALSAVAGQPKMSKEQRQQKRAAAKAAVTGFNPTGAIKQPAKAGVKVTPKIKPNLAGASLAL